MSFTRAILLLAAGLVLVGPVGDAVLWLADRLKTLAKRFSNR